MDLIGSSQTRKLHGVFNQVIIKCSNLANIKSTDSKPEHIRQVSEAHTYVSVNGGGCRRLRSSDTDRKKPFAANLSHIVSRFSQAEHK